MDPRKGNAEEEKPREENSETVAKRVVQSSTKNQKQKAKDDSMEHCKDPDDDLQKLKAKAGISKMVTETEQATAGGSMADWVSNISVVLVILVCLVFMLNLAGKEVKCEGEILFDKDEQIGVVRRPRGVKTVDEFERAIDNKCVRLIRILSAWYQSSRKKYVNNFEVEYLSTDELKEERDPLNWVHKVKLLDVKVVINRRFS